MSKPFSDKEKLDFLKAMYDRAKSKAIELEKQCEDALEEEHNTFWQWNNERKRQEEKDND